MFANSKIAKYSSTKLQYQLNVLTFVRYQGDKYKTMLHNIFMGLGYSLANYSTFQGVFIKK